MVEGELEEAVGTEEGHGLELVHIVVAFHQFVDGVEVAFGLDDDVAALAHLFEEFLGDVGDEIVVGIDMGDDTFDDVVFDDGTERATVGQGGACLTNLGERLAFGDHDGNFSKAVAGTEGEEVGILFNADVDRLVEPIVEDMAEHPIVGPNEILALGFDHHMRRLQRLDGFDSDDDLIEKAIDIIFELGQASTSSLQRKLKLGYARAARIMDELEDIGVIGPSEGSKPRKILMTKSEWMERKLHRADE